MFIKRSGVLIKVLRENCHESNQILGDLSHSSSAFCSVLYQSTYTTRRHITSVVVIGPYSFLSPLLKGLMNTEQRIKSRKAPNKSNHNLHPPFRLGK